MLKRLATRIQNEFTLNNLVFAESVHVNLRRLFIVACAGFPLHVVHTLLFAFSESASTVPRALWKQGIITMHVSSAIFMACGAILIFFLRRSEKQSVSPRPRFVAHLTIFAFLVWLPVLGIVLVAYDQYVTTNITPFLVVCTALGFLLLLRPIVASVVFGLSYVGFFFAIAWFQTDTAIILTNRVNGLTFVVIGQVLSTIIWLQFRRNVLQQRELEESRRELGERNDLIEKELDLARLIQSRLSPESPPNVTGFNIAAACLSMDKVGGDFYDLTELPGGVRVFVGDASGHGIPAAFLASVARTAFDFTTREDESASDVLRAMDSVISQRSVRSMFVTAVFARLTPKRMEGATAGHWPPLLFRGRDGQFVAIKGSGRPLGVGEGAQYIGFGVDLMPQDRLMFFTDGIVEVRNREGDFYGEDRLRDLVVAQRALPAGELLKAVFSSIEGFAEGMGISDDATLVVIDLVD